MKLAVTNPTSHAARGSAFVFMWLCLLFTSAAFAEARESAPPIVFVHGGAGSAAQYETQAMRWASNDYPNVVTAIDRTSSSGDTILLQLDAFFDELRAATNAPRIHVIAHSLGVAIMNTYLNSSPERSARVAKYIGIDSQSAGVVPVCPGNPAPLPCKGIYRSENAALLLGDDNVYLEDHGHTQAVTSEQSFAEQYRYLVGKEPKTTLVLPEPPDQVDIAGKVINFPANTGLDGSQLEIWEVSGLTGHRTRNTPHASIAIDASGAWGPLAVDGRKHYEFVVLRQDVEYVGHAYYQPFLRDDYLIRVLATPAGAPTVANTATGPDHSSAVVIRYNEWWSDQGEQSDHLWVTTRSRTWDRDGERRTPAGVDLLGRPEIAPREGMKVSLHVHDANADKASTLESIPFFATQAFQAGVDVWLPAVEPPDGTTWFVSAPRGDRSLLQTLAIANWASDAHRIGVQFRDYAQELSSWADCLRTKPGLCSRQRFSSAWWKWQNWLYRASP